VRRTRALYLACVILLFVLNVWIGWRLFRLEYSIHLWSVEGAFISLARYMRDHWSELSWLPVWQCGMPFPNAYQPLLPGSAALVSALSGASAGRAFHFVAGLAYALGPVTLFALGARLSGGVLTGFAAGLAYSLVSPSAWLLPSIRADVGGVFHARRLQATVVYGDSPHLTALTVIPLSIFLIDRALERRTAPAYFAAALSVMAVILTNIPGSIALAMAVVAYSTAYCGSLQQLARVAGICVSGYLLGAWWSPPSTLLTIFANAQRMEPAGRPNVRYVLSIVALGLATALGAWLFERFKVARHLRFVVLFAWITGAVVIGFAGFGVTLIAQPMRFHIVMEMAFVLAAVLLVAHAAPRSRTAMAVLAVAGLAAAGWQVQNYRRYARTILQPADMPRTSEFKVSRWFASHAHGARVLVPGSMAYWLNNFTDTPQLTGCCDQGIVLPVLKMAYYVIGSDDGAGDRAAEISIAWMQALGVQYVAVAGPRSTEAFKDFAHPWKFEGKLRLLWREGDDLIYEVPQRTPGLAHVVKRADLVRNTPENGLHTELLAAYVTAIEDPSRPVPEFRRDSPSRVSVQAAFGNDDVLSVQIPWHFGWSADVDGRAVRAGRDALGFITVEPPEPGWRRIVLRFDGGRERVIAGLATLLCWMGFLAWSITEWRLSR
jgi:hypothetical protein